MSSMGKVPSIGKSYFNQVEIRKITDVGPQCSPNGKFDDWVQYTSSDPKKSGACTFTEFWTWMGMAGVCLDDQPAVPEPEPTPEPEPIPEPEPELASFEDMNAMRVLQGHSPYIQGQYDRLERRGLLPLKQIVLEQIEKLSLAKDR